MSQFSFLEHKFHLNEDITHARKIGISRRSNTPYSVGFLSFIVKAHSSTKKKKTKKKPSSHTHVCSDTHTGQFRLQDLYTTFDDLLIQTNRMKFKISLKFQIHTMI